MPEVAANKIITFGGSRIVDGVPRLDAWGVQRANRVLEHYYANTDRFKAAGAWILCSGGWPKLGRGTEKSAEEFREGRLAARYLHARGIPASLIKDEIESYSTATNLANAQRAGFLVANIFTPDDPLGMVSHPNHLKRCVRTARRIGLEGDMVQQLPTAESDSRLREMLIGGIYSVALLGVNGAEGLERREEQVILPVLGAIQKCIGAGVALTPKE